MENKTIAYIEQLADLLFTKEEIIDMVGVDNWNQNIKESTIAFNKGLCTRKIKLRKSLLQLADNGSHPALEKAYILLDKLNASDV